MAGAPLGNQNGRKAKIWEQAIKRALARYSGSTVDAGLDLLATRMVKAAIEHGDDTAAAMIAEKIGDRLDGKPAQAIIGGEDGDNPVQVAAVVRFVEPGQ
jgi:hypothetical protein